MVVCLQCGNIGNICFEEFKRYLVQLIKQNPTNKIIVLSIKFNLISIIKL